MFNFAPILIGAAVGAGTSALFGGDPLRGGLLGGVSGGLFGGGLFDDLLKRTAAGGAASGLNTVGAATVPSAAAGSAGQAGLVFNPATGSFLNPEYYALASSANPIYTGAGSLGSQVSTGLGSLLDTPTMQGLREYMPSGRDLAGLGLQSAMQRPPMPTVQAPAGGITQGRAPDIAAVQNLVSSMRRKPQQGLLENYFG
jgi:hypothetical protein